MKCTVLAKPKVKEFIIAQANAGYTGLDLAKRSKVNNSTISQIVARGVMVHPKTAKKLADALGTRLEDIFELVFKEE